MKVRIKNPIWGVPISFLDKYCPTQFEIVGQLNTGCFMDNNGWQGSNGKNMLSVNGKTAYKRVLIRRKKQFGTDIAKKLKKKIKKLDFFNLTYYLYTERKKKQRKFGYIKICLYICNRWLVKTHTGGHHQKVRSFFHIYGKNF